MAGADRYAAVEDIARLRDALGITPPPGIAPTLLEPVADPLGDVVGRFARTHGPFSVDDAAADLHLPPAAVTEVLVRLQAAGRVAPGSYRPGGSGQEWVDTEVLRRLRRRSLAALRRDVEAVDGATLGRFLPDWQGVGQTVGHRDRLLEVIRQLQGLALPASSLEGDILSTRMAYQSGLLDDVLASGEVVWMGRGPLTAKDGRIALYLRDQVPLLHWEPGIEPPEGAIHNRLREHLAQRGASFFRDLYVAAEGGDPTAVLEAVWDLVWSGEVTNDTLAPLRAFLGSRRSRKPRRPTVSGATPPAGSGRWYLTSDLLAGVPALPEVQAKARAEQLLERHGVVTRDAVLSEGQPGGFAGLYPVLAAMEDAGRTRRGYFIEGLGGAQFGQPGAIDRLRAPDDPTTVALAAVDPANPYGATLAWPDHKRGRPARRTGAHVILRSGELVAYVERGARRVLTFGDPTPEVVAPALAELAGRRRQTTIETVDGDPVATTALGAALQEEGFSVGYKGLTYRPQRSRRRA
jgi:ATP-dependent Lhr-like helicase